MKVFASLLLTIIIFSSLNAKSLESVYKIGNFKIFYTTEGKNKLPIYNQVDKNRNGTPDYIEFVGVQLEAASMLFKALNFIDPLKSDRYRGKVHFISVKIVSMQNNGTAYDEISKARKNTKEKKQAHLAMKISNKLSKTSLTPLHEYFHIIQNGYTMFKNRWYTEGTARWSESLLKNGIGTNKPLPKTNEELEKILSQTYDTSVMWNRLTHLVDRRECQPYGLDGYKICGTNFMKIFLENLNRYDKIASQHMGYQNYRWKETDQKSSKNNRYILTALADSIVASKTNNSEVKSFLNVIHNYVNY